MVKPDTGRVPNITPELPAETSTCDHMINTGSRRSRVLPVIMKACSPLFLYAFQHFYTFTR
ncbi:hypothetical protein KDH_31010 [Dictyobacter sp. S3.2.2.5]|uniref:Uncharacterized protein n=1 Tax=Dictyobacter halimunensis TaxID=3026934 RepID=A0ABQ6FV03_9CHLR|nr:hypothetical protein KDH_31010 [Dictyobacter sp. S3.2.2.5]